MRAATRCVDLLDPLVESVIAEDHARTLEIAKDISAHEHGADKVKNEIRDHLPRSIFLPVAREDLLDIIRVQDGIADSAEDVGVIFTLRRMESIPELSEPLRYLARTARESAAGYGAVIAELDKLVEASFAGKEAERVLELINRVGELEHEADVAQARLSIRLFEVEDKLKPAALYLWIEIIRTLSRVANRSETAANRLRMFLAT
jgi:hypothetical protein